MVLINFGFTKIEVNKGKTQSQKVNIQSGMNITNVAQSKTFAQGDQVAFLVSFKYGVEYTPNAGTINLEGDLLYLVPKDTADTIEKEWNENKVLLPSIALPIYNRILHSCTVEALLLSREIGLPPPIKLPKLQSEHAEQIADKLDQSKKTETATKNTPKK